MSPHPLSISNMNINIWHIIKVDWIIYIGLSGFMLCSGSRVWCRSFINNAVCWEWKNRLRLLLKQRFNRTRLMYDQSRETFRTKSKLDFGQARYLKVLVKVEMEYFPRTQNFIDQPRHVWCPMVAYLFIFFVYFCTRATIKANGNPSLNLYVPTLSCIIVFLNIRFCQWPSNVGRRSLRHRMIPDCTKCV